MKTMTRSIALVTGILALRLWLAQVPAAAPAGATGETPFLVTRRGVPPATRELRYLFSLGYRQARLGEALSEGSGVSQENEFASHAKRATWGDSPGASKYEQLVHIDNPAC